MEREIQEIELPGGETVLARVGVPAWEEGGVPGGEDGSEFEDVGVFEALSHRVDQLNELIGGVGSAVLAGARSARPDEVTATFGIELMLKPGKAVAVLADGQAKAAVSVTLTWKPEGAAPGLEGAGDPRTTPVEGRRVDGGGRWSTGSTPPGEP